MKVRIVLLGGRHFEFLFMVPEFGLVIRFERLVDLNQSSVGSKGGMRRLERTNESSF